MNIKSQNKLVISIIFVIIIFIILILNYPRKTLPIGELTIYTPLDTDIIDNIKMEFNKKYPRLELNFFSMGTKMLMERVNREIVEGSIQADIIWAIDFTISEELKNRGQLLKYKSPQATKLISFLKDKDDYYCAANLLNMVIAYNTDNIKKNPISYHNLLDPEYRGKIGFADPDFSQATLYTLENLVQSEKFGWDYFVRLYENEAQIIKNDLSLNQAITNGKLDIGITIDFIVRGLKDKNPNLSIDYVFPEDEIVVVPCPIAIIKGCKNLLAAQVFIDFILSREGQRFLISQGISTVRQDVVPPKETPAISQIKAVPLHIGKILEQEDEIKYVFKEMFSGKQAKVDTKNTATLYCSLPETIADKLRYEFEIQNPGSYLKIYHDRTNKIIEKINQEIEERKIQADLIWIDDFVFYEELKERGALLYFIPPEVDGILDILKDKEGYYAAGRILVMVMAYNTNNVHTKPVSYRDLLDIKYQGRIGHDTPMECGSFLYFMGTLLSDKSFGEEFFINLKENLPQIQTCTQTAEMITAGDLDIGITQSFLVHKLLKDIPGTSIDYIFPNEGVVLVPCPIAIIKNTPYPQIAMSFTRYLLSREGQTLMRDIGGFIPVRLDVSPPDNIPSITRLKVIPSDKEWIEESKEYIISKFNEIYGITSK